MAFIQKSSANGDAINSVSPSLTGVGAGHTLALLVGATNPNPGAASYGVPTDSAGQTWLKAVGPVSEGNSNVDSIQATIYYLLNANSGTHNLTWNVQNGSYVGYTLVEFAACSAVDVTTSNGAHTAVTTGNTGTTATTTQANDVALVVLATNTSNAGLANTAFSTPSGYTSLYTENATNAHLGAQHSYQELAAMGTQSATWTWTNTSNNAETAWQAVIATFKLSGSASAIVIPQLRLSPAILAR